MDNKSLRGLGLVGTQVLGAELWRVLLPFLVRCEGAVVGSKMYRRKVSGVSMLY